MKKISIILAMCLVVLSFGVFAQLKVDSSGNVGIGLPPIPVTSLMLAEVAILAEAPTLMQTVTSSTLQ